MIQWAGEPHLCEGADEIVLALCDSDFVIQVVGVCRCVLVG